jgi:type I restriction enzyme, R subunit
MAACASGFPIWAPPSAPAPGGVVVDYLGIADQVRDAIQTYTQAGGEGRPVERIQEEAVPVMQRYAEELATFFNGFDYAPLLGGS